MAISIRPINKNDETFIDDVIRKEWGSEIIVVHGKTYKPKELPGLIAEENSKTVGLLTYKIERNECEIVTLNSLIKHKGIGTLLLDELKKIAEKGGCNRVWVVTTNDNLNALRFYQKNDYKIKKIYPDAVEESRKIKPQIPLIGENGIPIKDEIELELNLA